MVAAREKVSHHTEKAAAAARPPSSGLRGLMAHPPPRKINNPHGGNRQNTSQSQDGQRDHKAERKSERTSERERRERERTRTNFLLVYSRDEAETVDMRLKDTTRLSRREEEKGISKSQ